MGYEATDLPFFAITGLGDGAGVLAGHCGFYLLKKVRIVLPPSRVAIQLTPSFAPKQATFDDSISISRVVGDGTWLASAAFCSGAAWQPTVNLLQV